MSPNIIHPLAFNLIGSPINIVRLIRLPFSEKKIIPRNREDKFLFTFILSEFHLFRGTENARNSVLSHSPEDKKALNSVKNHFVEEKSIRNFEISFRTLPRKIPRRGAIFQRNNKTDSSLFRRNFQSGIFSERKFFRTEFLCAT